jgi:uncharacterized protein (DUF433 family)
MTTVSIEHIVLDDHGVPRIAGGRSKVTQIVCDLRSGMSPEMIREAYPHLSLAQIYTALSYCHDHKAELDARIEEGARRADALRARFDSSPAKSELVQRADGAAESKGDHR